MHEHNHRSRRNFLLALITGQGIQYFALGYVAHIYGRAIIPSSTIRP